ncbi:hypothetical protein C2S52_010741 [Perilla frutescens var. hirtella]|nr:hypothetical protein C2S52_010741 [Perilla frutescens var. hirtella]
MHRGPDRAASAISVTGFLRYSVVVHRSSPIVAAASPATHHRLLIANSSGASVQLLLMEKIRYRLYDLLSLGDNSPILYHSTGTMKRLVPAMAGKVLHFHPPSQDHIAPLQRCNSEEERDESKKLRRKRRNDVSENTSK